MPKLITNPIEWTKENFNEAFCFTFLLSFGSWYFGWLFGAFDFSVLLLTGIGFLIGISLFIAVFVLYCNRLQKNKLKKKSNNESE